MNEAFRGIGTPIIDIKEDGKVPIVDDVPAEVGNDGRVLGYQKGTDPDHDNEEKDPLKDVRKVQKVHQKLMVACKRARMVQVRDDCFQTVN